MKNFIIGILWSIITAIAGAVVGLFGGICLIVYNEINRPLSMSKMLAEACSKKKVKIRFK